MESEMAKKKVEHEGNGAVNKSESIRLLLKENPTIKAHDAVAALAAKGIKVTGGLFYIVKGKALGRKKRRKKREATVIAVVEAGSAPTPMSHGDAVDTILKLKTFAAELGGLKTLKKLVDALSE
jgi:hypothetical protein